MSIPAGVNNRTQKLIPSLNRYHLKVRGCDAYLDVESFSAVEAFSTTYQYTINFTSTAQDIPLQQMLRCSATFTLQTLGEKVFGVLEPPKVQKVVHGVVTRFQRLSGSADEATYQVVLEPKFALLDKQKRSYRFFLNKSVPEIVDQVLREHHFKGWEFEFTLKHTYPRRAQVNQVNESDKQYLERLLSEVGIFYTFALQPDTQTEVIHFGDCQSCYTRGKSLPLRNPAGMNDSAIDSAWGMTLQHQVVEQSVQVKDYNHRIAHHPLLSAPADMTRGDGEGITYGEVYHYLPRHLEPGDKITPDAETANFWARLDHERFLVQQTQISGKSTDATLATGQVLTLSAAEWAPEQLQVPMVITGVTLAASRSESLITTFSAIPYSEILCYRPPLIPRPVISGTLTARITSSDDNDKYAHLDTAGLYWVKFDADRDDKRQGYESMPLRLAKPYGGDTYGLHFPLIQGTEVAIAFHHGDPDRPYIAHALHESQRPDHITARNHTRNIIRTPANNKLRMEDRRGEEHIKLSTEYSGKSQLNLGHIVDAQRDKRGEGAELRSDGHIALRGGSGVFISAEKQAGANGQMLDMESAINLVKGALNQVTDWQDITESHKNLQPASQSLKGYLQSADQLQSPAMLLSAPKGIGVVSPEAVMLQAGEALYAQSMGEVHIASGKRIGMNASHAISLLSHTEGVRVVSAQGPFQLESHADELSAIALKDITVQSSQGHLQLTAKNGITLACGGGHIRLTAEGQIEIHSTGLLSLKGHHVFEGAAHQDYPLPELPQSVCQECLQKAWRKTESLALR